MPVVNRKKQPAPFRAIGVTCGIGSMLVGARQAGFDVVGNVEWRRYYHLKDKDGRNTFRENFPGAVFKYNVDELTDDEEERMTGADIALGHPESFRPETPVFTSKGWVPIGDIEVGDLVLTHRGRFRRVYRTIRYACPPGTDEITLSRGTRKSSQSLTTTGNHPVQMEDGSWRPAREVRKGEKIRFLCVRCPRCGDPTPASPNRRNTCYCHVKNWWTSLSGDQRKRVVQNAHEATRKKVRDGKHAFQDADVRRKGQVVQSMRSPYEKVVREAFPDLEFEYQHPVGPYFVDLALPDDKIAVEVDGGNWHQEENKAAKDRVKTEYLREAGWNVVRVSLRQGRIDQQSGIRALRECVDEVRRILANHNGEYEIESFTVKGLWRSKMTDGEPLCNLSVEEDDSYITNGYVTANCGAWSNLRANKNSAAKDPCDIPLFVDLVARFRPRFFVMDDLPKSFGAFSMEEYHKRLPDYDLFPEWISNYHYGNVQKHRKRMFMIGSRKEERWAFVPGEDPDAHHTLKDCLAGLTEHTPNNEPHVLDHVCGRAIGLHEPGVHYSWRELRDYFQSHPEGHIMHYFHRTTGKPTCRFGLARTYWEDHCHVITGLNPTIHPVTCLPLSVRERARVQGFPDDFVFYGTKVREDGTWNHDDNNPLIKQTGKAMPIQFCRYVSNQVMAHVRGVDFDTTSLRVITPNAYVDQAKRWYCGNVGYSDQARACRSCWMKDSCEIRTQKYGVTDEEADVQRIPLKVVGSKARTPKVRQPRTAPPAGAVVLKKKARARSWDNYEAPNTTLKFGGK